MIIRFSTVNAYISILVQDWTSPMFTVQYTAGHCNGIIKIYPPVTSTLSYRPRSDTAYYKDINRYKLLPGANKRSPTPPTVAHALTSGPAD